MKRIGIFVFYDKYGTVNKYVKYLLRQMNLLLTECCIVCNGDVTYESRVWLKANSNYIFFRENKGYDAGAYQDAILNRLGLSKLREFDELVLFNNSFYGPIYSFADMFEIMERRKVDFWGITDYGGESTPYQYHIQSYFMVIEDRLLKSEAFENYWKCQNICETFRDAVENFELKITDFFMKEGFICNAYIDCCASGKEYGTDKNLLNIANYELLVERQCPIVKRKYIMQSLEYALMQNTADILDYIRDNTDYKIEFIWEDLIKEYSPYELASYRNLQNYLFDSIENSNDHIVIEDICIVIDSIWPKQFIDYLTTHFCNIPVVICTEKKLFDYGNETVVLKGGQSIGELFSTIKNLRKNIQYFCILKDSKYSRTKIAERRRNYDICRNLINSGNYIARVKNLFEQQPYLGALFTEETFDDGFLLQGFYKKYLLKEQAELLKKKGCHAAVGEQLIDHAGCFWIRADTLKVIEQEKMINRFMTEKDAFEVFPYFIKAAGYYSGMLYNIDVVKKEYIWKNILLNELMEDVVYIDEGYFKRQILEENILKFVRRFQDIYIYGAGKYSERLICFFKRKNVNIKGIVITSKKSKINYMGYPVKEVAEIRINKNMGIIVAMSKRNQKSVRERLKDYPEENIYYV